MRLPLFLASAVLVVATACGTGQDVSIIPVEGGSRGIAMLSAAAHSTADVESGRLSVVSHFSVDPEEAPFVDDDVIEGAFGVEVNGEFSGDDLSFAIEATGLGAGGLGDVGGSFATGFETRMVDGVLYMRNGFLGDDRWMVMGSDFGGDGGGGPLGGGSVDLAEMLAVPRDLLDGAAGTVEELGIEDVRAGRATHYRVTVEADAVADSELATEFGFEAMGDTPVDLWIDDRDLMVKMETSSGAMGVESSVSMEFFDLGSPIAIEAPADAVEWDLGSLGDVFGGGIPDPSDPEAEFPADEPADEPTEAPSDLPTDLPIDASPVIPGEAPADGSAAAGVALESLRPVLEELGVDPGVVDGLPALVEEIRVVGPDMSLDELDAYIGLGVVELVGTDETARRVVRAYVDLMLETGS